MIDSKLILIIFIFEWLPIIVFSILIEWVVDNDRYNKRKFSNNRSRRIYIHKRNRNRRSNHRYLK